MIQENFIATLPQTEQKALSVCGIYKAEQLQKISPDALLADMQQAAELFPKEFTPLTRERLSEIYQAAGQRVDTDLPLAEEEKPTYLESAAPVENTRALPPLITKRGQRKISVPHQDNRDNIIDLSANKAHISDRSNAICHTHPFRTYISAIVLIAMVVAFILFIVATSRLLLDIGEQLDVKISGALAFLLLVLYFLFTRKTKCPVCNMAVLSMNNYPRNKHAHYFPLLGYTLSTALHIVFFFWFRCPACGTSLKFFKHKRR